MSTTIYLYLKTHNVTGLKYLGQTKQDPFVYKGSGKRWLNHIKKHGNDVSTEIIAKCDSYEELRELGLYYSSLWSIVESKEFANLTPEGGEGNKGFKHSEKTKNEMRAKRVGIKPDCTMKGRSHSKETKEKMSLSKKGYVPTQESIDKMNQTKKERGVFLPENNPMYGKKQKILACPHCKKEGGNGAFVRWHFDNCKFVAGN